MKITFYSTVVHVMANGRSHGTLTRFSLPGDKPEAWSVELRDPDGVLDGDVRHSCSSRADAEAWAYPRAARLAEHAEDKLFAACTLDLADVALG